MSREKSVKTEEERYTGTIKKGEEKDTEVRSQLKEHAI